MPLMIQKNRLREIRKDRGLSGYDLQLLSHIKAVVIYQIERGLKRPLNYQKSMISEALGVPEDEIFPYELEKNREIKDVKK